MECRHITRGNNKCHMLSISSRVLPRWATVAVWADDTRDYQGPFESRGPSDLWSPAPRLGTVPESPQWKLLSHTTHSQAVVLVPFIQFVDVRQRFSGCFTSVHTDKDTLTPFKCHMFETRLWIRGNSPFGTLKLP